MNEHRASVINRSRVRVLKKIVEGGINAEQVFFKKPHIGALPLDLHTLYLRRIQDDKFLFNANCLTNPKIY